VRIRGVARGKGGAHGGLGHEGCAAEREGEYGRGFREVLKKRRGIMRLYT